MGHVVGVVHGTLNAVWIGQAMDETTWRQNLLAGRLDFD